MKTLITGGAGFIGSHLADALAVSGHEVVVLDSLVEQVHGPRAAKPAHADAEFIHGDVRSVETVAQALAGVDNLVHMAAETAVGQSMYEIARSVDVNDHGTAAVLQAIVERSAQLRRLVLFSSRAVYGEGLYSCPRCGEVNPAADDRSALPSWELRCPLCGGEIEVELTHEDAPKNPASVYAATKVQQERLTEIVSAAYGISAVALRPFNVYGPGQSLNNPYTGILSTFYSRLSSNRPLNVYEDGAMLRDFVSVRDAVVAVEHALEASEPQLKHSVFNVATGTATTVLDLGVKLRDLMSSSSEIEVTGAYRLGDIRHSVGDTTRARDELHFKAAQSLQDGLIEWLAWAGEQRAQDSTDEAEAMLQSRGLYRRAGR